MDARETSLKPCPFCGSAPIMRRGGRYGFWALCPHCGAALRMSDTEADAVRNWNRRAAQAQTSDALEDAVRIMRAAITSPARNCDRYATVEEAKLAYIAGRGYVFVWDGDSSERFERWLFAKAEGGAS